MSGLNARVGIVVRLQEEYTEFFVRAEAPSATAILDLKRKAERGEARSVCVHCPLVCGCQSLRDWS